MFRQNRELNADFWNMLWHQGFTSWDLGKISPPLAAYADQLENRNLKILIPGCGNAHEAEYLLEKGFQNITLIDIADRAAEVLHEHFKDSPEVQVFHEDFFNHQGTYDLILEQTFFCTLLPEKRKQYAKHMAELLRPKGKLAGVLFNTSLGPSGPPFGGTAEEYLEIFEPFFQIEILAPCRNSAPARQGMEYFIDFQKK